MPLRSNGPYPPYLNFIESISSREPIKDFPLVELIKYFDADSGSFWLRDDTDPNEIVLIDTEKRPDLKSRSKSISISAEGSTFEQAMRHMGYDHFLYADCEDPALLAWRDELRENRLKPQIGKMLFLPLSKKGERSLIGAVIMHSTSDFGSEAMEVSHVIHLQRTLANIVFIALEGNRQMLRERHKIGHEVSRQINDASQRVMQIREAIQGKRSMTPRRALGMLEDAMTGLKSARDTVEKETFAEAVNKRARTCTFVDFNEVFLEASHLALAEFPTSQIIFNGLTAPKDLTVKIHETDLSLMFSNLISNAAKYSILKGDISCRWEEISNDCRFIISNNSVDLEAYDLEMMWRYGYRGTNSSNISGEGVGLSVVSDICDAYGLTPQADQSYTSVSKRTSIRINFPKIMARIE